MANVKRLINLIKSEGKKCGVMGGIGACAQYSQELFVSCHSSYLQRLEQAKSDLNGMPEDKLFEALL